MTISDIIAIVQTVGVFQALYLAYHKLQTWRTELIGSKRVELGLWTWQCP